MHLNFLKIILDSGLCDFIIIQQSLVNSINLIVKTINLGYFGTSRAISGVTNQYIFGMYLFILLNFPHGYNITIISL